MHQDVPFEKLVEVLQPERDLSRAPFFQVMLSLQQETGVAHVPSLQGLQLSGFSQESASSKFDLTLALAATSAGLFCTLEYSTDLFKADTIRRMLGHFQVLLEAIIAHPDVCVDSLPLLTASERECLLGEWNRTQAPYPRERGLHELFERQAELTPDALAVVCGEEHLTYAALNRHANQLAHYLRQLGAGPEVLVGVCMPRCAALVIALQAVLKAGGAYVPLDSGYPQERLAYMQQDARLRVMLTHSSVLARLPRRDETELLCLDSLWRSIQNLPSTNPGYICHPEQCAYVIYTSGSTGQPKGVVIKHSSAVALVHWACQYFDKNALAGVLASTSICFDLSIFEIFVPLCAGGSCLLVENLFYLSAFPGAGRVTLVNTVPSVLTQVLSAGSLPASVSTINLAGEALPLALVQYLYRQETLQAVCNLYGPTEDTIYSTVATLPRTAPLVPIGRVIANGRGYVLDERLQPVPIGVVGELYLAGAGLARGYLQRADLTAERFVPDPFVEIAASAHTQEGARLYRTGDRVRYLADGQLEYLGRADQQVKLRGYRIELGEIEMVLNQHPAINASVVTVWEAAPGDKRLVACIVRQPGTQAGEQDLRTYLKERLPEYMVPSAFLWLASLPITSNGKIDRRALPVPDPLGSEKTEAFLAPATPAEEVLAGLWAQILQREHIGIDDNFFALGGHSLLAAQVVSWVRDLFQIELPLRTLFEKPTINELLAEITSLLGSRAIVEEVARVIQEIEHLSKDEVARMSNE